MIGQNNNTIRIPMEGTQNFEFTREKQQALLISSYKKAVALLHRPSTEAEGKNMLLQIIRNPDSLQASLKQLRLSALLSLAQLSKMHEQYLEALYYWHQATKIESCFNTWYKMAQILQKLRIQFLSQQDNYFKNLNYSVGLYQIEQQIQYAYKNSIKQSPDLWKQRLKNKLLQVYIRHGKNLQSQDLLNIIANKTSNKQLYNQKTAQYPSPKNTQSNVNIAQDQQAISSKQISIPIYNFLPHSLQCNQNVIPWDYLLTACSLLLNQSVIQAKKYVKKYQEIVNKIVKVNVFKTNVLLQLKKSQETVNQSQMKQQQLPQANNKADIQQINGQPAQKQLQDQAAGQQECNNLQMGQKQNEKISYEQKRQLSSEAVIQQKMYSMILDVHRESSKDNIVSVQTNSMYSKSKKLQITNGSSSNKAIFQSLLDYYREVTVSKSIDLNLLNALKYIDPGQNQMLRNQLNEQKKQSIFSKTLQPILQGVNKIIQQKEKQKQKQKQIRENGQNQQEQGVNTRQRRSNVVAMGPNATPGRHKPVSEQSKYSQQILLALRQQFVGWIAQRQNHVFPNVIQFSVKLVQKILQTYYKLNLISCQSNQGNNSHQIHQILKNTNKNLANLVCRILQYTQLLTFVEQDIKLLRVLSIVLMKHLEQQLSNSSNNNNSKLNACHGYLLTLCHSSIDNIVYHKSMGKQKNSQKYTAQQLLFLLQLHFICIVLCTLPNLIDQQKLAIYESRYKKFYQLYMDLLNPDNELVLKPLTKQSMPNPDKLKQQIQNRLRKSKLKQLSQQEYEETVLMASIDKLLKTDMKTSQTIQSVKGIMSINSGSIMFYLKSFAKVSDMLFANLQNSNGFNPKFVQNALKVMQMPMLIQALYNKLTEEKKGQKQQQKSQKTSNDLPTNQTNTATTTNNGNSSTNKLESLKSEYKLKIATLFNLLKIYLLNELDQNHSSLCFRIVLFLLQQALKTMEQIFNCKSIGQMSKYIDVQLGVQVIQTNQVKSLHYQNQQSICKIIILIDSLIKMRQSSDVRKRFYQRILIKNINFVYRDYYNHQPGIPLSNVRLQIYKIFNDTFHSKSFKPRKMEDCLGYFLMISRQFASQFDKHQVEFEQKMKRVFNQCYLIFKEQFPKEVKYCDRFNRAMEIFVLLMRKKHKQNQVAKFFTGQQAICQCCQGIYLNNSTSKQPFAKQILLVVAKFLQNKKKHERNSANLNQNKDQQQQDEQKNKVDNQKQQKSGLKFIELQQQVELYYLRYFLLAVNSGKAWHQMLRFQISKVYEYFDALISQDGVQSASNQPSTNHNQPAKSVANNEQSIVQLYKHKFKYAKNIGSFIIRSFNSQDFASAKQYALYRMNITNSLKIRQRKLNKKFAQIEKIPQLLTLHGNKYMQGILTIIIRKSQKEDAEFMVGNKLPEISFLMFTQFKLPFLLYQCENYSDNQNLMVLSNTIKQGLKLIKYMKRKSHGTGEMVDENCQAYLSQSKYQIRHLQFQLKVQISAALCQLILDSLQQIEKVASESKNEPNQSSETKKFERKRRMDGKEQQNQKSCLSKLQLLLQINKIINENSLALDSWARQNTGVNSQNMPIQIIDSQQRVAKKVQLKHKQLFPKYAKAFNEIEDNLQRFLNIFDFISKRNLNNRTKKQNYCRYIFNANLWTSRIYYKYGSRESCLSYVKEIANLKNQDLINFYHHYENQPTQQNLVLAQYYSRDIVFHYTKIDAVQFLIQAYSQPDTLEISLMLIRKLSKMYIQKTDKPQQKQTKKQKQNKKQSKDKQKEKQKDKVVAEQIKENEAKLKDNGKVIQDKLKNKLQKQAKQAEKEKQKKFKKEAKQAKQKAAKAEKKIKWIYVLFLRGCEIYLESIISQVNLTNAVVDQKFEKALLEFKNKLKKQVDKDKKKGINDFSGIGERKYAARLLEDYEQFIGHYEAKFSKKIRMKTIKKKNETQENLQKQDEQSNKQQNAIQEQKNEFPIQDQIAMGLNLVGKVAFDKNLNNFDGEMQNENENQNMGSQQQQQFENKPKQMEIEEIVIQEDDGDNVFIEQIEDGDQDDSEKP